MERLRKYHRITNLSAPKADLDRIWKAMPKTEQDYVIELIGETQRLVDYRVEWPLLQALIEFWNPEKATFVINGMELTPTLEEYRQLVQGAEWNKGIILPEFEVLETCIISKLLQAKRWKVADELMVNTKHGISIELLIKWIGFRMKDDRTIRGATHAYLLLFFGTLLFPRSQSHIDAALANVVLQVVEGRGFIVALLAETITSLNLIKAKGKGVLRASPALLQIWFLSHLTEIGAGFPKVRFLVEKKIISRVIDYTHHVARGWNAFEWKKHFLNLLPKDILWVARWFTPSPVILGCKNFKGVPLISHLSSAVTYPARVVRQLGGLQGIPMNTEGHLLIFDWHDNKVTRDTLKEAARRIQEAWKDRVEEEMHMPGNLNEDEQMYRATKEYIHRFHTIPDIPVIDPMEILGQKPSVPHSSHEDIYETLAARVEIQSAVWAQDRTKSKRRIEQLQKDLSEARAIAVHQQLALEEKERKIACLSANLKKFKRRAKKVQLFSKHLSVAFVQTKGQALDALSELRSRVKRLRT